MAKRVLKDWTASEKMDAVSIGAEVFFTRLIMKADDFGSYYANPKLLKAALFPLKEVTYKEIGAWVFECIHAGLIFLYEAEGKEYIRIVNFGQRLRNMRNAFPHPSENNPQQIAASVGDLLPEEEEEEEEETKQEAEPASAAAVEKKDSRETIPFPDESLVRKAWDEWVQYRKEKKKTLTPSTIKKQIQFLGGRGDPEIIEIINQSIRNGWEGLFDLKPYNNKQHGRAANKRSSDAIVEGGRPFGTFD